MVRQPGRNALVITLLTALLTGALLGPLARPVQASPGPRAAAFSRVMQINSRRKVLEQQLIRLKSVYATKRAAAESLHGRLESEEYSLAKAPQERAKLLDQTVDAMRIVAQLAGKLQAIVSEDADLETELGAIVAKAKTDADVAALDKSTRGVQRAKSEREYVANLRERAKALPPRAAEAKRARTDEIIARWETHKSDAERLIARYGTEPRFARVTASQPDGDKSAKAEPLKTCRVRDVDWKNLTITVAGQSLKLVDGKGTIEPKQGTKVVNVTLKQLDFADSNLDTREEAVLLVEREERAGPFAKQVQKSDVLYVFENVLDCSLRRLAEVTLPPGGEGKVVRNGYEYSTSDGVRSLRWTDGLLREASLAAVHTAIEQGRADAR